MRFLKLLRCYYILYRYLPTCIHVFNIFKLILSYLYYLFYLYQEPFHSIFMVNRLALTHHSQVNKNNTINSDPGSADSI